jgi:hypothetical protein
MLRSMLVSVSLSLALVVGLAGAAHAGDVPYPAGKVSFWLPDDWTNKGGGDEKGAMLATAAPDQSAGFIFTVTDAKDVKKAQKLIKKLLSPIVTDAKMGKGKNGKLNGMKETTFEGAGKASGKPVKILVMLIETPAKKVVLAVGLADADKFDANEATLMKIVTGIKPMS